MHSLTESEWQSILNSADEDNFVVDVLGKIIQGPPPEEITEQMNQDLGD